MSHSPVVALVVQNPVRCRRIEVDGLEGWLSEVATELLPAGGSLTLRLVGDAEMRRLNRTFRDRDATTDVLSFPLNERLGEVLHIGDIALSVPTARRQADARSHRLSRELKVLALHGLLHCLGHDHDSDGGEMERLERTLRGRWIEDGT